MQRVLDNIESLVECGSQFRMVVTGYSMLPLLGYGRDHIMVRRIDHNEPIEGRIAMFRSANRHIIVHRVLGVDGEMVIFQGDGNLYQKERCRRDEVIGVVDSVIRESGKVVSCTTASWRRRERMWLCLPLLVRRLVLGILRRCANFKRRNDKK